MSSGNPVGSIWKKWDLHVHTPCSVVQNYGGNTDEVWERFIADLEQLPPDFKVIGVNDYIFVDGYERVLREKRAGRLRNIELILPVVELRLDKFAGVVKRDRDGSYSKSDWNRINLHIIFDQLDPEVIRQQFLSSLVQCYHLIPEADSCKGKWQAVITPESLTKLGQMIIDSAPPEKRSGYASPQQEGFNNLCVSLESVLKALERHDLKNHFLLAVGKTEWENLKWDDQSIAEKRNVINCVDLVFTASANPDAYDKARKKLSDAKVLDRLLDCSDAHALSASEDKDRIGQCYTWIKANATFQGLLQAVTEFDQRVFIGDKPPKHSLVASNKTKYASSISIKKKIGSPLMDTWFDIEVPLNHDLVAIIGNKGSGKSALSDIFALIGDTKNHRSFSFLNEERFRDPKNKLAAHFTGSIRWEDGTISQKDLHESPTLSSVERVKYLPQSYLETLCNELAGSGSSTFDGELRKIIYTHVPEDQRIGFQSLDDLLGFKLSELDTERKQQTYELEKINAEIAAIEHKLSPEFRQSLEQQLDVKKRELAALEGAKPVPVDDPQESEASKQESAIETSRLGELETTLNGILSEEQIARQKKTNAIKCNAQMTRILQAIKNYQKSHDTFIAEVDSMLSEAQSSLRATDVVSLTVDTSAIESVCESCKNEIATQEALLSGDEESSLSRRREAVESAIQEIKNHLGEKQRLFLIYKEQVAQWEQAKIDLQGDKDKNNTVSWFGAEIDSLGELPDKRDELKCKRIQVVRLLHEQIGKVVEEYRTLYQPVQGFVQSATKMEMPLPLDFDVRIAEEGFQEKFLGCINRQARGSFAGVDESNLLVRRLLKETDFMNVESVIELVEKIDDMLHFDRRVDVTKQTEASIVDQLRKGNQPNELYNYIFGLNYLKPQYSLTYDKQEISQLSPGERGLLLLVFYLLVDKDDIPLVIDQPEENLDNQTIFKVLVSCIKTAKQRRQVIMVTHNPNLAVVCDAEQIICATCDKVKKRFSYSSGAIESQQVKTRVIEILEGTEPAFLNRKRKYGI